MTRRWLGPLLLAAIVTLSACGHPVTSVYVVNDEDQPFYLTLVVQSEVGNQTDFVVLPGDQGVIFSDTGDYESEVTLRGTDCAELDRITLMPGRSFVTIERGGLHVTRDVNVAGLPQGFLSQASVCVGI